MRRTLLISTSALALITGSSLALAQGQSREAPSPAPPAQQSAPAEKMAPGGSGAQQPQKSPNGGTTGQGAPSRAEQDKPGAQAPSGAREGQDRTKSGDPKASEPKAGEKAGDKAGDKPSTTQAPGGRQDTTGQGAAGRAGGASLTQEQRTKITTTIKQTNVRPVTNVNFSISVGATVPRTVELHPLPPTVIEVYPQWRGYRFVLVKDEIIIIEPDTYRIVAVIDA